MTIYTLLPFEQGGVIDLGYTPFTEEQHFTSRTTSIKPGDEIKADAMSFTVTYVYKHSDGLKEGRCKCRNQ